MRNYVELIGRLGNNPEVRTMTNGSKVATFRLATTEVRVKNNQRTEYTEWHSIEAFGDGLVGIIEKHVGKGDLILVAGSLRTREWEKDGVKRYSTSVVLSGPRAELKFLNLKDKADGSNGHPPVDGEEDEIPFD